MTKTLKSATDDNWNDRTQSWLIFNWNIYYLDSMERFIQSSNSLWWLQFMSMPGGGRKAMSLLCSLQLFLIPPPWRRTQRTGFTEPSNTHGAHLAWPPQKHPVWTLLCRTSGKKRLLDVLEVNNLKGARFNKRFLEHHFFFPINFNLPRILWKKRNFSPCFFYLNSLFYDPICVKTRTDVNIWLLHTEEEMAKC